MVFVASSEAKAATVNLGVVLKGLNMPTSGCCSLLLSHPDKYMFSPAVLDKASLNSIKDTFNIQRKMQTCYVGVSTCTGTSGFIFEGNIPVKFRQLFSASPALHLKSSYPSSHAMNLAVLVQPVRSADTDTRYRFSPYKTRFFNKNVSVEDKTVTKTEINSPVNSTVNFLATSTKKQNS
ncbi:MAG: hypothetical protein ACI93R_003469 [Flavobacteriales bacterium]|jgi:hypothetical protein